VARRFRGEFHQKVDPKGRVSVPALFRRVVEAADPEWSEGKRPNLIIVYGDHRRKYLECYTIEAIDDIDRQIDEMPRGSTERKMLERLFHGQSHPTQIDEDGRIILPQKLREKIGLGAEAFFIASGDRFHVWKPETYESEEVARTEAWLEEFPDDFDPLSLLPGTKDAG
jgi:MraZ protein